MYFVLFMNGSKYTIKDLVVSVLSVLLINKISLIIYEEIVLQLIIVFVMILYMRTRIRSDSVLLSVGIYTLLNHYTYSITIEIYHTTGSYLAALSGVLSIFYLGQYLVRSLGKVMTMEKNFKYSISVESNGHKYNFDSFLDTGNFAKEFFTNRPVVFINEKYKTVGVKKCDDYIITASGYKKIQLYEVDRFAVILNGETRIKKVYLSYINMQFDAIIGLDILN